MFCHKKSNAFHEGKHCFMNKERMPPDFVNAYPKIHP